MKKTDLVSGAVYNYALKNNGGDVLAYLVDGDRRWYADLTSHGLRYTLDPHGVATAAQAGYLALLFREGASLEETVTAQGLTARDVLKDGRPDLLPRFARLAVVNHLRLSPLSNEGA